MIKKSVIRVTILLMKHVIQQVEDIKLEGIVND